MHIEAELRLSSVKPSKQGSNGLYGLSLDRFTNLLNVTKWTLFLG